MQGSAQFLTGNYPQLKWELPSGVREEFNVSQRDAPEALPEELVSDINCMRNWVI